MTSKNNHFIAYTDGASRGNPGPSACATVIICDGVDIARAGKFLGTSTNNRAEYNGVILALRKAAEFDACRSITIRTDSQLIARQLKGGYKIKDAELKRLNQTAIGLFENFDSVTIEEIPREENSEADKLANRALDMGLGKKK